MAVIKDTTLHCFDAQANHDKIYLLSIEESNPLGKFVVNFEYGRRGSALKAGTKTPTPVTFGEAENIYNDYFREKVGKGYKVIATNSRVGGASKVVNLNIPAPSMAKPVAVPTINGLQLLNPIEETEAEELIKSPDWWMQEKFDGKRIRLHGSYGKISMFNKKAIEILCTHEMELAGRTFCCVEFQLDGELIGKYHVFDILSLNGIDLKDKPYEDRYDILQGLNLPAYFEIAPCYVSEFEKRQAYEEFKKNKKEGVVFKRAKARYTYGRPHSGGDQRKCKFWASASCIVIDQNGQKRSISVRLVDNQGKIYDVGKVTIPPNFYIPNTGDIVEVKYLYATATNQLYQSIYLGKRDDVDASECLLSQLKYKGASEDD